MRRLKRFIFRWLLVVCFVPGAAAWATDNTTAGQELDKEVFAVTKHRLKKDGLDIRYTATAGYLILKDDHDKHRARMFFIAYEQTGGDKTGRPVTFAFNGGPGSSSVWLHFGAMGPKRVHLNPNGTGPPPPAVLLDNEFSWLSFTDIVFIDPVGTGYSRAIGEKKEKQFFGVRQDIEAVADFIRLYCTRYNRWLSPMCIVGESYGTMRAVGLAEYLHSRHGIALNGLLLVSPVLDFTTILFDGANDLAYSLLLPSFTATAWYHTAEQERGPTLTEALDDAEEWVLDRYIERLARGNSLSGKERRQLAEEMAARTGLTPDYILKNNLRVSDSRYRKELLRSTERILGRMDSRITGPGSDAAADSSRDDPSLEMLIGLFSSAANSYIRNALEFQSDLPYRYLNYQAGKAWDWSSALPGGQGYVDVSRTLGDTLRTNGHLKVFIASGYYDFATPYFSAKYTVRHLALDEQLQNNIITRQYPAGHMMYIDSVCLKQLTEDVRQFYTDVLSIP